MPPKNTKQKTNNKASKKTGLAGVARTFLKGTDRIADCLTASPKKGKRAKSKKLKDELVFVVKDIASSVNKNLKEINLKDGLHQAVYEIGKFSRDSRDSCAVILSDIFDRRPERKNGEN